MTIKLNLKLRFRNRFSNHDTFRNNSAALLLAREESAAVFVDIKLLIE